MCPEAVCKVWILGPSLQVPNSPEAYSSLLPCMLNHLEVTFHVYCDMMQGRQLLHFIVKGIMTRKRMCVFNMDSSVLCFVLFLNTFHLKLIDSTRAEFLNAGDEFMCMPFVSSFLSVTIVLALFLSWQQWWL